MNRFYKTGLCFECKRCSGCCRHSGYVFLSKKDVARLSESLGLTENDFMRKYCRTVVGNGEMRLSLIEQVNTDCIFYDLETNGCAVYEARPLQCRLFPFWERLVNSESEWNQAKQTCPGIDQGRLYTESEIEELFVARRSEPLI